MEPTRNQNSTRYLSNYNNKKSSTYAKVENYAKNKYNTLKWEAFKWAEKQITNKIKTKFTLNININNSRSRYYIRLIDLVRKTVKNSYKYIQKEDDVYTLKSSIIINTHNKCFIYISVFENDIVDSEYGSYVNGAKIYIVGPNAKKIHKKIIDFLNYSPNTAINGSMIKTYNIVADENKEWTSYRNDIEKRRFDTIFLNGNIENEIKEFIKNWEDKEDLFSSRGLTHKTGILIYGKPGTGKTTIAKILASEFDYTLINIDSTKFEYINIAELVEAINNEPGKHIVFIDEIDSIFKSRDDEETTDAQTNRTNRLLAFLDGINSPNHTVFVATTNYFNKLDKAVTRKGRFDKIVELSDLNKETAKRMCKSFELGDNDIEKILSAGKYNKGTKSEYCINPAELQSDIIEVIKKKSQEE